MAYRRVLLMGDKLPETKTELENMFSSKLFKTNYAGVKTKIIVSPVKNDTLVVDLNGEGADTVSKKVKDIGQKYKMKATIKTEKPMSKVGESKITKSALKEIIKEEIKNLLNEENNSITIEGISATGKGYTVWEGSKPIGDLRQKIGSYPKNGFGEINVGGNTFNFYYVTQIKTDKLPYIKSLKDHVGRAAYFTVSAPKDSGVSKEELKTVADNILEKNKNQDGIKVLKEDAYDHTAPNVKDHPVVLPTKYIAKLENKKTGMDAYIMSDPPIVYFMEIQRKTKLQFGGGKSDSFKKIVLHLKKGGYDLTPLYDKGIIRNK